MDETTHLDWLYQHERTRPDVTWLTQPLGGESVRDFTFREALDQARRMAAHLGSLGLPPGSRIAIFSKNTAWWLMADIAIWMAGHVSVPIYPTLTPGSIRQILEHSAARLVFVGKLDNFAAMEPGLPDDLPRITTPLCPPQSPAAAARTRAWEDIVAATPPIAGSPRRAPSELATIIYTSGSTGEPKGALHSFRTMAAARVFADTIPLRPDDRMISYLPLAHVAERACLETTNFLIGYHVYFAESLDTFVNDLRRARPTVFGSVPRLWQKFQSGVFQKMPPGRLATLLRIPLLGGVVRRKVLDGLGLDQARAFITGSAPTPPELHAWWRSLGCELGEIYGMTENFAVSHFTRVGQAVVGTAGTPAPGVEVKLKTGSVGYITQALGGSFTVYVEGNLFRIAGKDADALGKETADIPDLPPDASDEDVRALAWRQMKTCYDPEIPINVVDLGLIYECSVKAEADGRVLDIKMTLTAPGCGMGDVLVQDVREKVEIIPTVKRADVELVFDPPWDQSMMSEAARLQTGMM